MTNAHVAGENPFGLTLLALLAVALVAAESRREVASTSAGRVLPRVESAIIVETPGVAPAVVLGGDVAGAKRELKVRPLGNRLWPDLGWSGEGELPADNGRVGF